MNETTALLVNRLQTEGQKTVSFFQDLPPTSWQQTVYTDGAQWNLRQVLAHFIASEASMGKLIENIVMGGTGTPEDFNINQYNEKKVSQLDNLQPVDLIQRYIQTRDDTCARIERLAQEDLNKTGRHPFLGVAPVVEIIKLIYRHNQIHLREVRKAIALADEVGEDQTNGRSV